MCEWESFLREHQNDILGWMSRFAPEQEKKLQLLLQNDVLDTQSAQQVLHEAWAFCSDSPSIRTVGFFRLCDLLDGTVEL